MSVEALTDRPTNDPSINGVMKATGLPRPWPASVGEQTQADDS